MNPDADSVALERRPLASPITLLLAATHIVVAVLAFVAMGRVVVDDDVLRFHAVSILDGRPWRDVPVEYAPGEVALIELMGGGTVNDTGRRTVVVAALADAALYVVLRRGWGKAAADRALAISIPLLPILFLRLDLVPIVMTIGGFHLVRTRRERSGGVVIALAVLTKIWPVVLIPVLALERRWRALGWTAGTGVVLLAAWVAFAGWGAPGQVLGFRGATGWEVESVVGVLVWIATGVSPILAQGAPRIGSLPGWARPALFAGLAGGLAVIWWSARRWNSDLLGAPALGALAILLVLSPVVSLQYAIWLVPFAAIALGQERSRSTGRAAAIAVALTGAIFVTIQISSSAWQEQLVIVLRNTALIGTIGCWAAAVHRSRRMIETPRLDHAEGQVPSS